MIGDGLPFSQQYFPNPPFTQQSGYAKSGAPFEHFGFGGGGGGGGLKLSIKNINLTLFTRIMLNSPCRGWWRWSER